MATSFHALICVTCGDAIPADGPAVGLWKKGFGIFSGEVWIPKAEDAASTDMHLMHTVCFSNERGQDALEDLQLEAEQRARE